MKKMKKRSNGFTLTELAIVIAVIAILIAVLVPTFVSLINSANESSDKQLVKNINTALSVDEAINGEVNTMSDALAVAAENGYNVDKLTPASSGDIVWDQDSNRFLLINEEGEIVYYDSSVTSADVISTKYKLWYIATSASDVENGTYSYYLNYETDSVEAKYGVDVGNNEDVTVTITGTSVAATIIVNTNGGTLTVDAENYDVSSYGRAQSVTITAVSMTSFHVYGEVTGTITLTKGHLDIQASSTVSSVYVTVDKNTSGNVKVSNSSSNQIQISANDNEVASTVASGVSNATALQVDETVKSYFNGGLGTEANPFQISTSQQFSNINKVSSNASEYGYNSTNKVYYKITNDIELTTGWDELVVTLFSGFTASSYGGYLFYAVLDGSGYTLTPSTITVDETETTYNSLFTQVANCEINNLVVNMVCAKSIATAASGTTELNYVDVEGNITFPSGNYSAYIIYAYADITLNNCTNYAKINGLGGSTGYDSIFIAYCQTDTWCAYTYTFNNCVNEGSLTCGKAAMFVANLCSANSYIKININNCKNNGVIRSTYTDNSFTPNYYIASGSNFNNGTFTLDGISYTLATEVTSLQNVYNGPDDEATISLNDDGYFVITKSSISGAYTYVISVGLYVNLYTGGTSRFYVTLTVTADDLASGSYTSNLMNYKFIDLVKYKELSEVDDLSDAILIGDSSYIVTFNEGTDEEPDYVTYYLVDDEAYYFTNGTGSSQTITLSVYDDEGNLLSSPSM